MSHPVAVRKPVVDGLTVVAIAAIAISLTVAFHEGVHALTCLVVGGNLQEYSALYASCDSSTVIQAKIVAGSAPVLNLLAGTSLWIILRSARGISSESQFFVWLLMLMNWFYGAGYLVFSGIANIGDWAVVIDGWEPSWAWRILITIVGLLLYFFFVRLGFGEFGRILGGEVDEGLHRAKKLCTLSYLASVAVILVAGLFCPYGFLSLPLTAGLTAVMGTMSPLIWRMRWFRPEQIQAGKELLEIRRQVRWLVAAVVVVFAYVFILGRTLYF